MAMPIDAQDDGFLLRAIAARYDDEGGHHSDPVAWGIDKLKRHYWGKQREIMTSVVQNRYTVVHSAHELGKSLIAADIIAWWIDSHPIGEAFVVSTAPSAAQVSAILWREIGKAHRLGELPGKINRAGYPQWIINSELVGYGRKPADYEDSAFQGIHARYVLVVIDEAGGVSKSIYDAIDSIVANDNSRVLAIGNPDDPGSHFAAIAKPGTIWHSIHLDGLRSPNMTEAAIIGDNPEAPKFPLTAALMRAEQIPFSTEEIPQRLREVLMGPLYVEEGIRRWGGVPENAAKDLAPDELADLVVRRTAATPLFEAKVRGVFPSSRSEGVIPMGWVRQAMDRWNDFMDRHGQGDTIDTNKVADPSRHVVGVDVARYGEDETVLALRYGNVILPLKRFRQADTTETTDYAASYLTETHSIAVVDVIGIGAGVYDLLRRYRTLRNDQGEPLVHPNVTIVPFNAAASTTRTDLIGQFRFRNDRAAAWWKMRELLDPSKGSKLMLPDDERLLEELVTVRYEHLVGGVIKIESKDDIKARLNRSTDSADAVIQAFWVDGLDYSAATERSDLGYRDDPAARRQFSYDGYDPFTDADLMLAPGLATSNADTQTRYRPEFGSNVIVTANDWDV